jgi:hypothetical protein
VLSWDGTKATSVRVPGSGVLRAVAAVRPDDVWAQGLDDSADNGPSSIFLLHWDGERWTRTGLGVRGVARGLVTAGGSAWLYGGDGTSGGKPFLFGDEGAGGSRGRHDPAFGGGEVNGMALVPGTGTIWAVGSKGSNEDQYKFYRLVQSYGQRVSR